MFTADEILARIREQPFTPVRVVTSAGQAYDIYHPDLVLVARRFLVIGLPSADNPSVAELVTRVAVLHVTELQDLSARAPSSDGPSA